MWPGQLPSRLYHYTRGEGLLAILENGRLHATHIGSMNDSAEFWHGVRLLRSALVKAMKVRAAYHTASAGSDLRTSLRVLPSAMIAKLAPSIR